MQIAIPILVIISWIFLIILIVVSILAFQAVIALFITRVPYGATPMLVIRAVVDKLNVDKDDVVYDLGCGDARFLAEVNRRGVYSIGYELRWWQWLKAKIRTWGLAKTEVRMRNFYKDDLSDARVVFCFLLPNLLIPMRKKLEKELKQGTKIYSYVFSIEGWEPVEIMKVPVRGKEKKVYVYSV